ncbi:TPA: RelA/SpoT domain-containing protein [Burkholderia cenocepacia]|uniref:RelA/SpoT domain-containing protein n=1 Tax=Burkholderia cepacia complex TaxID=87882 RepID=UPI000F564EF5|nr:MULTISPECIES: RelA/SpoT domain-containing protein [Burkholderia cepacia complex]MBK1818850.1 RelA/SpoT domain-containing protein [Burkholderia orbicola]MBR7978747.1 RelA/SpoT domain-containing protein [Burkholderia cenocepacia]MBR8309788.1 RelA/SpoT domain-containing protein [Burkholderia cenocepacia]MBR8319845.1 RelA/SpoT domain-containing protein [Burkholderia cenocepacia]RQU78032.1 (p)ppGpp synthetase [Burkholderia cenocepacia]
MATSKATIDRSGNALSREIYRTEDEYFELEDIFDEYRKSHLQPLSETTLELQGWLAEYGGPYYIAQRLKRKPQIIRKLKRLSVRLSQLQDIGGSRIIVPKNSDVDKLLKYLQDRVKKDGHFSIKRITDYRPKGRDTTGYRAVHLIIARHNLSLEVQIRSRVQHYWAESIERTSVIYGYHLKEGEGDYRVLSYFSLLSDAFYELEAGREASAEDRIKIDALRLECESLIKASPKGKVLDSFVNEGIIKTLTEKEIRNGIGLKNWIIVFDWNTGSFVSWDIVGRSPSEAIQAYVQHEKNFPADSGFEVVLIGSSEVSTVRQTHSHYFGIDSYDNILETLDTSIVGFQRKIDLDVGAREILLTLSRRRFWGSKTVSRETLKNHFCRSVLTFDSSLNALAEKGLINIENGVSLNIRKKADIDSYF